MIRLRGLADESVDCVVTSVPYFQCRIFPGATTVFGGDRSCVHDWQMQQVPSTHYSNVPHVVESGKCRTCGAQLVMLGWEDSVAEYVQHLVEVFNEVKRVCGKLAPIVPRPSSQWNAEPANGLVYPQ